MTNDNRKFALNAAVNAWAILPVSLQTKSSVGDTIVGTAKKLLDFLEPPKNSSNTSLMSFSVGYGPKSPLPVSTPRKPVEPIGKIFWDDDLDVWAFSDADANWFKVSG